MTRTLGARGPAVTSLGLGLAALGRPGYITLGHGADFGEDRSVSAMERRAHAVLDAAYGAGVRYFDAARSYGRAEAFLASWLAARGLRPGDVTVGSKWGYTYTADWRVDAERHEVKDHGLPTLRRQLAESRALLGPHLALYQIHSATFESGVLDDTAVLAELVRLREEGVAVGLSLSGASQGEVLRRALEVRVDGAPVFSCVQATWNLLERSAGPALAEAHAAGWGVIVKEAVANGRLTSRDTGPETGPLRELAAETGVTPDALALAAVLARPWVSVVLSGASTVEQLRENLAARSVAWSAELEARLEGLAEEASVYWGKRSSLPWN
ncbi:aldo/keto reductase [Pyxidicoccus fallax]|uniref:Aldo/keto reductase n=1 Tax=Pyxidicoccus fallax TaxID=394095 RepID=A0A848LJ12_9BACT|nr:aldo/keto reductase [Pyxidicoccus fallax]NMO17678.1 aldo/keto reductase [Pyxidicoccus fallax]NPC78633.1 aldo/keto reductase [Pyxidicoccus fallax]